MRLEVGREYGAGPHRRSGSHSKVKASRGRLTSAFLKPHSPWLCVGNLLEPGTGETGGRGGGAYHSEPEREGEVEGVGGCTRHHWGGQSCTKPSAEGWSQLREKGGYAHTYPSGSGKAMGSAGPAQRQACHGEDSKEYLLFRLHKEILI